MDGSEAIEDSSIPSEIIPGLYIGSLRSLALLEPLCITHVLSAVNFPVTKDLSRYATLQVALHDDEGENLLQHLPAAYAFIRDALAAGGKVLVHCQAGVSRSVAVVAAYLMKSRALDATAALELIRSQRPSADPNEGFHAQLGLFYDMKYSLDEDHPVYRMWCLHQVGRRWEEQGWLDPESFAQLTEDEAAGKVDKVPVYRCRKCRRVLVSQRHVMPVDIAVGHKIFRSQRRLIKEGAAGSESGAGSQESSLFVEPLEWMADAVVGQVQGKLHCPGCQARLGSFNWSGITNERGQWVTPAFQLHVSKLDTIQPVRQLAELTNVRRPLIRAAAAPAAAGAPVAADGAAAAGGDAGGSGRKSRAPWFDHLILDCDGVMVDTERASCESLRQAILEVTGFDIPHEFPRDYNEVFGMDVRSCVAHYKSKFNRNDWGEVEDVAQAVLLAKDAIYKRLTAEGIQAFEGAAELIQSARSLGMGVAVASSGAPEKIDHNLTSSGLRPLIPEDLTVSASHVAQGKPAPDVYLEAMRRLECIDTPKRSVVVEDAVNGLKAARAAGAFAVGITNSLPRSALEGYADLVIDRLRELDLATLEPPASWRE